MIETLGSPWLAYAALVVVTGGARLRCGSWFAPAAFVGLVWTFFVGASLLAVDYPVPGRGLWMLVLLIVSIQLGALIAHELSAPSKPPLRADSTDTLDRLINPCRRFGLLFTGIAMAGCIYFLVTSLDEFGLPFTPIGVLEVGARWTLLRYDDALEPWSVRLLVTWFHPAALLGGILFACSHRRTDRAFAGITLVPSFVYGILTGARAAILLGLTCWIGAYLSSLIVRDRNTLTMFTGKRLVILVLTSACMLGMFAWIDAVRNSSWIHAVMVDVREQKLKNYMFGSPAAFADWYAHADISGAEWGARTFAGEFDLLHLKKRISGRYLETSNLVGTEATNVYTFFRGLIEDCTEIGAILVAACGGGLAGWLYSLKSKNVLGPLLGLSAFYAALIYSPIVSLFSFNGAALAWIVAWFILTAKKSSASSITTFSRRSQELRFSEE